MAFGAGVLISALAFDLMDEAYQQGGFDSVAIGFVGGAAHAHRRRVAGLPCNSVASVYIGGPSAS